MAGDCQYCQNCRRNIAAANYVTHSAHCERKIQLCTICDEPVPRTEMEQHLEENHTIEVCELCSIETEKWQMDQHKDTCYKRPVLCKFCELEFPFDELDDHKDTCGTRTEKCTICKVYVKLKDQDAHLEACQRERRAYLIAVNEHEKNSKPTNLSHKYISVFESQTEKCPKCNDFVLLRDKNVHECKDRCVTCEYCNTSMPIDLFGEHISLCGLQTEICPKCSAIVMFKDRNTHACQDRCVTCEYCNTSIPFDLFCEHISLCGLQTEVCLKCSTLVMFKDRNTHACQSPSKSFGKCSICHETVPWIDMREHESSCRLSMCSSDDDEKPKFSAIPMHQKRQSNYRQLDSRPQKGMQETANIHKMKQCLYCKERYPDLIIKEHVETCGERPFTCELCLKRMLFKDQLVHETRGCQMVHCVTEEFSGNKNSYSAVASGYTRSYENKLKQCSYCHRKFAEIMFTDHLVLCEERPYQCSLCLRMMPWRNKINHDLKECTFLDKVKRQISGSEGTHSKDAPVYKKTFEKGYLENNSQSCPYCSSRIPEAKIAEHVQCCSEGKKLCRFCGIQIPREEETSHLQDCIGARNVVEEPGFQTSGSKRNKKKNKKGKQNEPVEQKSWFSSFIPSRKSSSPVKEFTPQAYFTPQPQMVLLPCEFCNELFPESLIIEHQSGCRPDLVSFPNKERSGNSDDRRASPRKDAEAFMPTLNDHKDVKNTGALPKRNRFHRNDSGVTPGEYLFSASPPKKPSNDRDYFNYASGVPDFSMQPDDNVIKRGKTTPQAQEITHDNKTTCGSKDKKTLSKNSATPIFNFSSSSNNYLDNNSPSHQSKFARQGFCEAPKTELKAVGSERAERKGIRISRDSSINSDDINIEAPIKYNTNYQPPKSYQNSDNKYEKRDIYSPKMQYSEGRFNIPFVDETSNIIESEKSKFARQGFCEAPKTELKAVGSERAERKGIRISRDSSINSDDINIEAPIKYNTNYQVKSTCATRLLERLDDSDVSENIPGSWDITEDDAKNAETFGNDFSTRENLLLSHEDDSLSDSAEHFYDAEESLKISNVASGDGSPYMDSNLDVYFQFLKKDKDEAITPNDNRNEKSSMPVKEKAFSCKCENKICYCGIINQTAALENNNYLQTEAEGFEGHLQNQNTSTESTKLKDYSNAKSATNFQCEEVHLSDNENHMNSAEVEKRSTKWKEWRSKKMCNSDSE